MSLQVDQFLQRHPRSHQPGALTEAHVGVVVHLMGWVNNRRDHGGCIFIDLRDVSGLVQVVFDPEIDNAAHKLAGSLRGEWVVGIIGAVRSRGGNVNPRLATGTLEVAAHTLVVMAEAQTPPFAIDDAQPVSEEVRLSHRYLDLRRPALQANLIRRHRFNQVVRQKLDAMGFLELETPFLIKSTPEGARDYVVPSRVHAGKFFALPQSPQLFKQLFMVAGLDRYFQIVRCFRDEDLRAERQPEFTQVDLEMSFCTEHQVQDVVENLLAVIFKDVMGLEIARPIARIRYDDAMARFGSDAPDMRFGLELVRLNDALLGTTFQVFADVLEHDGLICGINLGQLGELSRRQLDDIQEVAKRHGAKGMAWTKIKDDGSWQSPIAKFLGDQTRDKVVQTLGLRPKDTAIFVADDKKIVQQALGHIRRHLAQAHNLVKAGDHKLVWVVDFPLFEYHPDKKRWLSAHHPFTAPHPADMKDLQRHPERVRAMAYDITLNGVEIGGGSIRIHEQKQQMAVFEALGIGVQEARAKFGFLLDALSYGAPPHGGLALGVDRILMQLCQTNSIRDVIAFPKTQKQTDMMLGAPDLIDDEQWRELHLRSRMPAHQAQADGLKGHDAG